MKVQQSEIVSISINFPNGVIQLEQRTKFEGYFCVFAFHPNLPDFHMKVLFQIKKTLIDFDNSRE